MESYKNGTAPNSMKISIRTSADGLGDVPVDVYADRVLGMVVEAYPNAFVFLEVDERVDVPTRVVISSIDGGQVEMTCADEIACEEDIREIVTHYAFEACCAELATEIEVVS